MIRQLVGMWEVPSAQVFFFKMHLTSVEEGTMYIVGGLSWSSKQHDWPTWKLLPLAWKLLQAYIHVHDDFTLTTCMW